jgi:hypothetical protein
MYVHTKFYKNLPVGLRVVRNGEVAGGMMIL